MSMSRSIPTFPQIQAKLLRALYKAANEAEATLSLRDYHTSLRLGLTCTNTSDLSGLLTALSLPDLIVSDPQTGQVLSVAHAQSHHHVRVSQRLLVKGRCIHGPESGVDLFWTQEQISSTHVTLPSPIFEDLPLNDDCAGQTILVEDTLLHRLHATTMPRSLDVIYTWVDDTDPVWRTKRDQYHPTTMTSDATDEARFINNDELLYALRGLFRYFHGIGTVYLVTDAQRPAFLDEFGPSVQLIDHYDIFPQDAALPTFNSHAIEAALHNIPNLRDAYLYSNDDMIMTRATGVCDFFDDQGRGKMPYSKTTFIPSTPITSHTIAADAAAVNAKTFLTDHYDHLITQKFQHTPVAINKNLLTDIAQKYPALFQKVQHTRFRSPDDLALSGSFYQHYALMVGDAISTVMPYHYFSINDTRLAEKLTRISYARDDARPTILCINSTIGGQATLFNLHQMRKQMQALLPPQRVPASYNTITDVVRHHIAQAGLRIIRSFTNRR